jgi:hypothetical protein
MQQNSNVVFCEKCGTPMDRVQSQRPRSFGMFSGAMETASTSSSPLVTTSTSTTLAPPCINTQNGPLYQQHSIKIIKYICPSCKWEFQKRDN